MMKTRNPKRRANIPLWLRDLDEAGPCPCGMPLLPNQPYMVGESEIGGKRWFHMSCWYGGQDPEAMYDYDD